MKKRYLSGLLVLALTSLPALSATLTKINSFGNNPGNLKMFMYAPVSAPANAPVVVAMHGCNQNGKAISGNPGETANATGHAQAFIDDTDWTKLADEYGFYVIAPEQTVRVTNYTDADKTGNDYACFSWSGFYGYKVGRGEGESASIISMIDYMKANYSINASKIYASGMSAGGAMALRMAAEYPDVFAGVSSMAGIAYGCAHGSGAVDLADKERAYHCMGVNYQFKPLSGTSPTMPENLKHTPSEWAAYVKKYGPTNYSGPYPKVMSWQGSADNYVDYAQTQEILDQWTAVHGLSQTPSSTQPLKSGNSKHTFKEFNNANGSPVVGIVTLTNMKHGTATDPGTADDQGGRAGINASGVQPFAAWAYDTDIFSTYYTAKWWGLLDNEEPTLNPVVAISSPANGATINGTIPVTAAVTNSVALSRMEFYVDSILASVDDTAPFSASIDTTNYGNGQHVITAKGVGETGLTGETSISVTVNNVVVTPGELAITITSPANADIVSGVISITTSFVSDKNVSAVAFLVDGVVIATDTASPYSTALDTTTIADGIRELKATITDVDGSKASSGVLVIVKNDSVPVDQKPTVSITTPANNSAVDGVVSIAANASDDIGVISVAFNINGTVINTDSSSPYVATWDTQGSQPGNYVITATATDTTGQTSSSSVTVKINAANTGDCEEFTMLNYWHAFAGRVTRKAAFWSTYIVTGTDTDVGWGWEVSTIKLVNDDFQEGSCN